MGKKTFTVILLACFLCISSSSFPSGTLHETFSLLAITDICLVVDEIDITSQERDPHWNELQEVARLRVEDLGLRVLPSERCSENDEHLPYLVLKMNLDKVPHGGFLCAIRLDLSQWVGLLRNLAIETVASTWTTEWFGFLEGSELGEIRDVVIRMLDQFATDYRKMNSFYFDSWVRLPSKEF